VLTTLLLLQAGYAYVPYSAPESVIEQSKEAYYPAPRQIHGAIRSEAPNWQPWLVFFLRALAKLAGVGSALGTQCSVDAPDTHIVFFDAVKKIRRLVGLCCRPRCAD